MCNQTKLQQDIAAARRAGVPIVAIDTPDIAALKQQVLSLKEVTERESNEQPPIIAWDLCDGVKALNPIGEAILAKFESDCAQNPDAFIGQFRNTTSLADTIAIMANGHKFIGDTSIMQSVWNGRDVWKQDGRMLIVAGVHVDIPPELENDVVVLDDPLPSDEELEGIVAKQVEDAKSQFESVPTEDQIAQAANGLRGCSHFAAEQLTAMSLRKVGVDMDYLNKMAAKQIDATPGLNYDYGSETFDNIGGLEFVKDFGMRLFAGPKPPAVVVRIEELEKSMSGLGDTSGTNQDALQVMLSEMEDNNWSGLMAYGAPGAGKSLYSKALANSGGAKPLRLDLGAAKGSLVGQSEQQIRRAMKVIKTIGGENVFFIASCNRLDSIPPELQRRFRCGVWFFDIPTPEQAADIWNINTKRFGLTAASKAARATDLTGADIRNICETAYTLNCSLEEAQKFVVPLKVQSPSAIKDARDQAQSKFICASRGGPYKAPKSTQDGRRRVQTDLT